MTDEDITMEPQEAPKEEWGNDISPDQDGKLFKKIIQDGVGEGQPKKGDEVFVHYTGRLLDGTVFDSSVERNELFSFKLGEGKVIKGWDVGVATMRKGEKCILTCLPEFAYGEQGAGDKIPPNSTLQFEVELFRWRGEDVTGDGGVIKNVINEGNGFQKPSEGSTMNVFLRGSIGEAVIEERELEFCLGEGIEVGVIEGIEKALEKMKEGEEAEIIIKSDYAFGTNGNPSLNVPPNTEVTYIVKLISFTKTKASYEYDNVDDRITDATGYKERGTAYFKASKYSLALKLYKRGLGIVEKSSVYKEEEKEATKSVRILLLLNMAACYLKLDESYEARQQCEKVLEEDTTSIKAHFRKGQAFQATRDYDVAMECFQEVVKLESTNRSALQQIQVCRQRIKEQREKDKKMYTNMFKKLADLSERDAPTHDEQEEPVKDAITEAMEKAEELQNGDETMKEESQNGDEPITA